MPIVRTCNRRGWDTDQQFGTTSYWTYCSIACNYWIIIKLLCYLIIVFLGRLIITVITRKIKLLGIKRDHKDKELILNKDIGRL